MFIVFQFHKLAESRVPANNTRVPIQPSNKEAMYEGEISKQFYNMVSFFTYFVGYSILY